MLICHACAVTGRERPAVIVCPDCMMALCLAHLEHSGDPLPRRCGRCCGHDLAKLAATAEGEAGDASRARLVGLC